MEDGDLVKLNCYKNVKDEATGVSDEIERNKEQFTLNNTAILVRYWTSCSFYSTRNQTGRLDGKRQRRAGWSKRPAQGRADGQWPTNLSSLGSNQF